MSSLPMALAAGGAFALLAVGCNAIVGNADHDVAGGGDASVSTLGSDGASPVHEDAGPKPPGQEPDGRAPISDDAALGDDAGPEEDGAPSGEDGGAPQPIAFVQAASQDSSSKSASVAATFAHPQHAGDLDVVVIGWSDATNAITSVTDSAGNAYTPAATPASAAGAALAIYYAPNVVAAASNTVTVRLDATDVPCVAILEYAGVRQLDQVASGEGGGASASSGTVMTSAARELIIGAGEPDQKGTANFTTAGAGFDERVITGTSGMLVEDLVTAKAGTYGATGTLTEASTWVMQAVTFR